MNRQLIIHSCGHQSIATIVGDEHEVQSEREALSKMKCRDCTRQKTKVSSYKALPELTGPDSHYPWAHEVRDRVRDDIRPLLHSGRIRALLRERGYQTDSELAELGIIDDVTLKEWIENLRFEALSNPSIEWWINKRKFAGELAFRTALDKLAPKKKH